MIKHISLYKLKDKSNLDKVKELLDEVGNCDLIVDNNVYISINNDLPNTSDPIFANIMHEAIFDSKDSLDKYPLSKEHTILFDKTKGMFESVTVFDYYC